MNIFVIILLAVVQGMAELLPVSSTAHVILFEKILGLNPSSPEMTFLLVMLHTGTMFAVLVYFWPRWKKLLSKGNPRRWDFVRMVIYSTAATGMIGLGLVYLIEKYLIKFLSAGGSGSVEDIFGNTYIIGAALGAVGILIVVSGILSRKSDDANSGDKENKSVENSLIVGIVQGLALPFRGFSRSGSTISASLLLGMSRNYAEEFSFILALIITPPVILREFLRLRHSLTAHVSLPYLPGILGMIFSFLAGIAAIKWLSSWLEKGRWALFGCYCLVISTVILVLTGMNILR